MVNKERVLEVCGDSWFNTTHIRDEHMVMVQSD